jgi:hypothetical protein
MEYSSEKGYHYAVEFYVRHMSCLFHGVSLAAITLSSHGKRIKPGGFTCEKPKKT